MCLSDVKCCNACLGLFEDQNKADSGYKSDHTRQLFDLPPPMQELPSRSSVDAGNRQRSTVTPPLPPPVVADFDSLGKRSELPFNASDGCPISITDPPLLDLPFPLKIDQQVDKVGSS